MKNYSVQMMMCGCVLMLSVVLPSCRPPNPLLVELAGVKEQVVPIHRYEKALFAVDRHTLKNDLKVIQPAFKFFLNANLDDTLNLIKLGGFIWDDRIRDLYHKTTDRYPQLDGLSEELTQAFRYYRYYFPEARVPKVYSWVSDLLYERPVIYEDSVLVIALDMYLGQGCEYYGMLKIPSYKLHRLEEPFITGDCFREMAAGKINFDLDDLSFLNRILYEGRILYFLDAMMPKKPDHYKIGYTDAQVEWCRQNESQMWSFFIEHEILFSTDHTVISRFVNDGPFTSVFPEQSPARTGVWLGWQIVRSYMQHNPEVSLTELLKARDYKGILNRSGYKPGK